MDTNKLLTISPSPHEKGDLSIEKIMYGVVIAMIPALIVSFVFFGVGAIKVTVTAIVCCMLFEYLIQKFMLKQETTVWDGSALITGMLLAFNLPSNIPCTMIIIGSFVAMAVGKFSFGGLGRNPFNPALIGRVFLLISFPVQMTSWPLPGIGLLKFDGTTGATVLGIIKEGLGQGHTVPQLMEQIPSYLNLFVGKLGGSLGEISAAAILLGGIFLLVRKIITWHIPVSYLLTVVLFTGILYLVNGDRFADPIFHLISGGLMLGAFFMATDMVTSPMTKGGMLIFGVGCGVLTVAIRLFGAYPEGVSFAILIMNAVTPLINRYCKPKRFGT